MRAVSLVLSTTTLLAAACSPPDEQRAPPCDDAICTIDNDDGSSITVVDATDKEVFHGFDLDTASPDEDEAAWDLRIRRFVIATNSGVSGDGGVETAIVDETAFADVDRAPDDGYFTDRADGDDRDAEVDSPFVSPDGVDDPWYAYDLLNHTLTPKERVYVTRTTEGAAFKILVHGYYADDGEAGHLSFIFQQLP